MKSPGRPVTALSLGSIDRSSDASAHPLDGEISLAAARLQEQSSVRVAVNMSMALPEGTVTMKGKGAFDFEANTGRLNLSLRGLGPGFGSMEAAYDFSDGFVMYMKLPQMAQMFGPGVRWIKMDLQKISEDAGFDLQEIMQLGQDNPMQAVDYLYGIKNVREVGKKKVRGVRTTHYAGLVDFEALLDELPKDTAASVEKVMELGGIQRVPVQVWLGNKNGLPRRVVFDYSAASELPLGKMRVDFFGYGRGANITMPEPHEVTDLVELMNQAS
jgi:hypothetical protein